MALTIEDISERLKRQDEVSLLEILEINSDDIVDRFQDFIEEHAEFLSEDLEDDNESN